MAGTLLTPHLEVPGRTQSPRMALAVADAGWYTTEHLFAETAADRADTLLLRCSDYRVAWSQGKRPWTWNRPVDQTKPNQWRQDLVLPSGWMKSFPRLGMRPIARAVKRWKSKHAGSSPLALVMTYPHYLELARQLEPDHLVYFNLDDYRLYWPKVADQVTRLEHEAVRRAEMTVCTSALRAEELRQAVPEASAKIRHLPHGAPSASIPDQPQFLPAIAPEDIGHLPRPLVGYVGTLEDRVDWSLMRDVAQTNPTASFVLVGRVGDGGDSSWARDRSHCLALPNVHAIGWRPQSLIDAYNRSFDLGLIPYRVDHPFNIASCPTKIMDYLASGRPVVSTNLPECKLYPHLFDVVPTVDFAEAVRSRLNYGPDDGRSSLRWAFARENACRNVVGRLLDWIG